MSPSFAELKQRTLVQWGVAYLAGAWVALQVIAYLHETFGWSNAIRQSLTVVVGVGFLVTLVLAWYHGEKGNQRATGAELLMLAALLVVAGTAIAMVRRGEPAEPDPPSAARSEAAPGASIAVLPFDNMSADPENAYFADGLAEEILNALARVPGLKVASRTSSFSFRGRDADVPTIAAALGVRTVLEGSVRKAGERVRITAQLVDAEDGLHLWAETYDRDLDDIFAVQEEIARAIAGALEVRLVAGEALVERPTESREAYEAYLRGRYLWNQRTVESLEAAVGHFERAVELDPRFALAWAGLADAYVSRLWYEAEGDWRTLEERGREAAERALEIDPELGQAHVALALCEGARFRWDASERSFRRGIELEPRYALGHYSYGYVLALQGRVAEAIEHGRVAVEIDPLSRSSGRAYGLILMRAGRYEDALAQLDRVRELDPHFAPLWVAYEQLYAVTGRWSDAATAFARRAELTGGDPEAARRVVAAMERHARDGRPAPFPAEIGGTLNDLGRSGMAVMLGQRDSALAILERMRDEGDPNVIMAGMDPWFAPLHREPRFVALLEGIGLRPVPEARAWMEPR